MTYGFRRATCTLISRHLAITAKHVLEDYFAKYGVQRSAEGFEARFTFWAMQILGSSRYGIWEVSEAFLSPLTDLAVLYQKPYNDVALEYILSGSQKQIRLNLFPPQVGDRIVGYGFHSSEVTMSKNPDGSNHIDMNDKPTATVGEVREIHVDRRESIRLNFPCFRTNARFDGGMSGGPVLNDAGQMCGVICSSLPAVDESEEHASYVASLWPAMGIVLRGHRGDKHPMDASYPLLELACEGIIEALGCERVEVEQLLVPDLPNNVIYGVKYR